MYVEEQAHGSADDRGAEASWRESAGIFPTVKLRTAENPRPSEAWTGRPKDSS